MYNYCSTKLVFKFFKTAHLNLKIKKQNKDEICLKKILFSKNS